MNDEDDFEFTFWDRLMCRNRFTLWAGSWLGLLWTKAYGVYDRLMTGPSVIEVPKAHVPRDVPRETPPERGAP